jgi:hypothetical protein
MSKLQKLGASCKIHHKFLIEQIENVKRAKDSLKIAEKREDKLRDFFYSECNNYNMEKYQVKPGDVIECDGDEFQFVEFSPNSSSPLVKYKLKSGKWSKPTRQLYMYDWENKTNKFDLMGKL